LRLRALNLNLVVFLYQSKSLDYPNPLKQLELLKVFIRTSQTRVIPFGVLWCFFLFFYHLESLDSKSHPISRVCCLTTSILRPTFIGFDVSLKGRNDPSQLTPRTQRKQVRMHGQRGGTVVLIGTVWSCQIAGCYGLGCSLGTIGRGFVFGVMADSKRYALALIMRGKE